MKNPSFATVERQVKPRHRLSLPLSFSLFRMTAPRPPSRRLRSLRYSSEKMEGTGSWDVLEWTKHDVLLLCSNLSILASLPRFSFTELHENIVFLSFLLSIGYCCGNRLTPNVFLLFSFDLGISQLLGQARFPTWIACSNLRGSSMRYAALRIGQN